MIHIGDLERGAEHLGVSVDPFRWRVTHTGVGR
jgi:hypothetical protein